MITATQKQFPILKWFLIFFGVIFIANGFLVYFAVSSWNGLTTQNAYEKGVQYNKTLLQKEKERNLNWQLNSKLEPTTPKTALFRFSLLDAAKSPLEKASIKAQLKRPTHEGVDQTVLFTEQNPGIYQTVLAPSLAGQWDIYLTITHNNQTLKAQQRLYIP